MIENDFKIGISTKITTLLLLVVVLAAIAMSLVSYNSGKYAVEERYRENLQIINRLKADQIQDLFRQVETNLGLISQSPAITKALLLTQQNTTLDSLKGQMQDLLGESLPLFARSYGYPNIVLLDNAGKFLYQSNPTNDLLSFGKNHDPYQILIQNANEKIAYGEPFKRNEVALLDVLMPIKNAEHRLIGYLLIEYDMQNIYALTNENIGLGQTGEIVLARRVATGQSFVFLNEPRHSKGAVQPLVAARVLGSANSEGVQRAIQTKQEGLDLVLDYKGKSVLSAWTYLDALEWAVETKIDEDELNADLGGLLVNFSIIGAIIVLIAGGLARIFSYYLTEPLNKLKNILNIIAKGELPRRVEKVTNDEIGEMAVAVNNLVQALKRTAEFAYTIGEGKYDAQFTPMSQNDILGTALISMRDNIQESDKREKERTWIVSGIAEIGQVLRDSQSIELLSEKVVAFICEKINAIQGAFYVVEEDEFDKEIVLMASYAYHKRKYLQKKFRFGQGLVGQAAIEQDTILRTEIPDDYFSITSGLLGDKKPKCLLLVPLITEDKVYGVLEFAAFEPFSPTQVRFVEETSLIIARTIFNIKINERTRLLLQESQQMGEELQLQQEVLRQNAEEMEATQEELKRTNTRLEEQIQEVNRTQKRMQVLLENASEVITIYEKNGKVRYISPSVETILGYEQSEIIGISDIENVLPESREVFSDMFEKLLENPDETATIQLEYRKKDGETVWLEATGTNRLSDQAVRGLVVNTRDITERRRAEKEARMRGQMQSLSENSPDLIMRLTPEGTVFYVNPTIKMLTGLEPEGIINQPLQELDIQEDIVEKWREIMISVTKRRTKISREIELSSSVGDRIMQMNAIPEFNDQKELESVLLVAHDITERKKAELEIRDTNKKISESINYARRIQGAILPESRHIQSIFPNSFIYYKPRDVVSGDFPWYLQKGNDIYIAAVDCTGHGVPGALISLVGYFILNGILNAAKENHLEAGKVLDLLNDGVTKTLRQDVEGNTKDGMDIALCRINTENRFVEYAGAHRPLFHLQATGELNEIKGDKFPIGGGSLYKTRTYFANHRFRIEEGDSIYLFSDGLTDQFGGTDGRKFSPSRLREVLRQNYHVEMPEMERLIDLKFQQWRGSRKQIDDILLIGIKF
ncbi:PAS domain S-box protein [Hugenholtzia roseola]|uniref:PAS domain S-box protein n=1 Tax=Hugenholtzia roseola TaxID=1002 RepID=UPI000403D851|nr:PAS domain S-box protein [Hugenholtzia roseola]